MYALPIDQVPNTLCAYWVHCCGGLVEEKNQWRSYHRNRNTQLPLVPATEPLHVCSNTTLEVLGWLISINYISYSYTNKYT